METAGTERHASVNDSTRESSPELRAGGGESVWKADFVEELMADALARSEADRGAYLEELCRRYPEQAEELRSRLQVLDELGIDPRRGEDDGPRFPERLGDYRLIEPLGGGGMGIVYLAEQVSLGREVALKLIRPEHLYFPGARERFQREVEAISRLQHPGIAAIYTVGEEEEIPFFAMERVAGRSLAGVLDAVAGRAPESLDGRDMGRAVGAEGKELDAPIFAGTWVEACLSVALQVAEALEHAHARGIVHRDVKPSNVMLTPGGRALLVDFGLTSSAENDRLTRSGSQLGTLYYMSPEQLRSAKRIDQRTDVYSLAATLCELLTLQLPYRGEGREETEALIRAARPVALRARNRRASIVW